MVSVLQTYTPLPPSPPPSLVPPSLHRSILSLPLLSFPHFITFYHILSTSPFLSLHPPPLYLFICIIPPSLLLYASSSPPVLSFPSVPQSFTHTHTHTHTPLSHIYNTSVRAREREQLLPSNPPDEVWRSEGGKMEEDEGGRKEGRRLDDKGTGR